MKQETAFTPGEWEVWGELNVQSKNGRAICSCGVNNGQPKQREENMANALLIAESPNLFDISKRCAFMFGNETNYPEGTMGYRLAKDATDIINRIQSPTK
jgi:hypothetical protein